MFKKMRMAVAMGLLATLLAACGGGSGSGSGSGSGAGSGSEEGRKVEAAISLVTDVEQVKARYTVQTGMGSTVHVRITAVAGTPSLETVMADSLTAFAGAAEGIKTSSSVSFVVTESGQENSINPTAVGLRQSPTVAEIIDFANNGG